MIGHWMEAFNLMDEWDRDQIKIETAGDLGLEGRLQVNTRKLFQVLGLVPDYLIDSYRIGDMNRKLTKECIESDLDKLIDHGYQASKIAIIHKSNTDTYQVPDSIKKYIPKIQPDLVLFSNCQLSKKIATEITREFPYCYKNDLLQRLKVINSNLIVCSKEEALRKVGGLLEKVDTVRVNTLVIQKRGDSDWKLDTEVMDRIEKLNLGQLKIEYRS